MKTLTRFIVKNSTLIGLIGSFFASISCYYSILLYTHLRLDIEELLPTTAKSVRDLTIASQELASTDSVVILVFSKDTQKSKVFVNDLANRLGKFPKEIIAGVDYKMTEELQFFKDRGALFLDLNDLIQIKEYIRDRIHYETELYNPLTIFSGIELREPALNVEALQGKYRSRLSGFGTFPGGYYATPDETVRAIVVQMPGKGISHARQMKHAIQETVLSLQPHSYSGDLEIKYTGNVENMLEESEALINDLERSTIICSSLIALLLFVFFRSFWAPTALIVSLFMSTFWTFGIAYFVVGYLNANTAFLASIVVGNGINSGILFLARYLEERRAGASHLTSLESSISTTWIPTLTGALATGFAYGALLLSSFRGFNQFGFIGILGMTLCWVGTYSLLPAFLTVFERHHLLNLKPRHSSNRWTLAPLGYLIQRHSGKIALCSVITLLMAFVSILKASPDLIETDLTKLRARTSALSGSGALYHYVDDIFHHSFSPTVILPKNREEARKIEALFKAEQEKDGPNGLIRLVLSIEDFIPKDQVKKISVLREIRGLLSPRILKRLAPDQKKHLTFLLSKYNFETISEATLPTKIQEKFRLKDGEIGKVVFVDKIISRKSIQTQDLVKFVKTGRNIASSVDPSIPVAGGLPVCYDMLESILHDGPKLTLAALIMDLIVVLLVLRHLPTVGFIVLSLLMGAGWLMGIIFGFSLKLNFLNFIALPIAFGNGIDYGVNVFLRFKEEGYDGILTVIQDTGGAVVVCSLTTMIGYSSLLLAESQAFVSFGRLAVIGELTCIVGAVISIPSILLCLNSRRKKVSLS